tara:strand:- start:22 stop:270 length:249 start_codon:yes stop_codon:yes gene_type:complete
MDMILNFISDKPWFGLVAAVIAAAAAFCAATKTPEAGTWKAKIYGVIDFIALNIGKAKDKADFDKAVAAAANKTDDKAKVKK